MQKREHIERRFVQTDSMQDSQKTIYIKKTKNPKFMQKYIQNGY